MFKKQKTKNKNLVFAIIIGRFFSPALMFLACVYISCSKNKTRMYNLQSLALTSIVILHVTGDQLSPVKIYMDLDLC